MCVRSLPLRLFRVYIQELHNMKHTRSTFHKALGGLLMHNPSAVQSTSCFAKVVATTPKGLPWRAAANGTKSPRRDSWQAWTTAVTTPAGVAGSKGKRSNMAHQKTSKQQAVICKLDFTQAHANTDEAPWGGEWQGPPKSRTPMKTGCT